MGLPIYLDYMATTPVDKRVVKKMSNFLDFDGIFGNPSSQHFYGYAARSAVENAREEIASLVNADSHEIVFTSGATESNNLAIKGGGQFYKRKGKHIVTCKTEHKSVLDTCSYLESQGFEVTFLTPEKDGLLDLNKLVDALRDDTVLVSIMHVNNEIGVIQDIDAIGKLVKEKGILFHVDAAQSAGKIPIDLKNAPIDLMSFSGHKVYGPKGIGALFVRQKPRIHLEPLMHGGEQEYSFRSGTLATHQIAGMGEAFKIAKNEMAIEQERILHLRECFIQGISSLDDIYINGNLEKRIAGNVNVSFANVKGEIILSGLKDLAASSGSACKSISGEPSYVLRALGVPIGLAFNSIRFSFGRFTTHEDIDFAVAHICEVVSKIRKL